MLWRQVYDPVGSPALSTILAAVPIVVLLGTLGLLNSIFLYRLTLQKRLFKVMCRTA